MSAPVKRPKKRGPNAHNRGELNEKRRRRAAVAFTVHGVGAIALSLCVDASSSMWKVLAPVADAVLLLLRQSQVIIVGPYGGQQGFAIDPNDPKRMWRIPMPGGGRDFAKVTFRGKSAVAIAQPQNVDAVSIVSADDWSDELATIALADFGGRFINSLAVIPHRSLLAVNCSQSNSVHVLDLAAPAARLAAPVMTIKDVQGPRQRKWWPMGVSYDAPRDRLLICDLDNCCLWALTGANYETYAAIRTFGDFPCRCLIEVSDTEYWVKGSGREQDYFVIDRLDDDKPHGNTPLKIADAGQSEAALLPLRDGTLAAIPRQLSGASIAIVDPGMRVALAKWNLSHLMKAEGMFGAALLPLPRNAEEILRGSDTQ